MVLSISSINITSPITTCKDFIQDIIDNVQSNFGTSTTFDVNEVSTRNGNTLYELKLQNSVGDFKIFAYKEQNGDIRFAPMQLQSVGKSFYTGTYTDYDKKATEEDPAEIVVAALCELAENYNGLLAASSDKCNTLIDNGKHIGVQSIAVVGMNNKVYYAEGTKEVESGDEDTGVNFKIKTPISEWLNEHTAIKTAIQPLPLNEKMDYIGKWLISNRLMDTIDSEEFQDIFRQAGLIGYTDAKVLQFYKLIS